MNETVMKYKDQLQKTFEGIVRFITRHRAIAVFILASGAIIAAVMQASTYLNPPRNETVYQEEVIQINYSTIDQEVVEKLEETQDRPNIDIDPDFDPTRNNPFAE